MFSLRAPLFAVAVAAAVANAAIVPRGNEGGAPPCSTAPIQCCNTVQSAKDPSMSKILGLLGVVVQGVDALVGLDCTPISIIGVDSGASCSGSAVCCQNNNIGGLISVGCVPVEL